MVSDTLWKFRDGYWRYQAGEALGMLILVCVFDPLSWSQLLLMVTGTACIGAASYRRGVREGREERA